MGRPGETVRRERGMWWLLVYVLAAASQTVRCPEGGGEQTRLSRARRSGTSTRGAGVLRCGAGGVVRRCSSRIVCDPLTLTHLETCRFAPGLVSHLPLHPQNDAPQGSVGRVAEGCSRLREGEWRSCGGRLSRAVFKREFDAGCLCMDRNGRGVPQGWIPRGCETVCNPNHHAAGTGLAASRGHGHDYGSLRPCTDRPVYRHL